MLHVVAADWHGQALESRLAPRPKKEEHVNCFFPVWDARADLGFAELGENSCNIK